MVRCSDTEKNAYIYGTISVALVSLLSLAGAAAIPLFKLKSRHRWLQFFVALAIASLAGDALLHLIPSVLGVHGHASENCVKAGVNLTTKADPHAGHGHEENEGFDDGEDDDEHEGHDHRKRRQVGEEDDDEEHDEDHDGHEEDEDHDHEGQDHDEEGTMKGGLSEHKDEDHEFEPLSNDPHAGHDHSAEEEWKVKMNLFRMSVIFGAVYALYLFETIAYNLGGHRHAHGGSSTGDTEMTPVTMSTGSMPSEDFRSGSKRSVSTANGVVPKSYSARSSHFDNGHYATPNPSSYQDRHPYLHGFDPHDIWAAKWYWMYPYAYHNPAYDTRIEMARQRALMNTNQHLPGIRHKDVARRLSSNSLSRLKTHPRIEEIEEGSVMHRSQTFPKLEHHQVQKKTSGTSGKSEQLMSQPDLCFGFKPIALMILMGDAVHNFADGLAIGVTFMAGMPSGIATSIAVAFHELPHEIGDFAVLIDSGLSVPKALLMNFVSALTAFAGLYVGIYLGSNQDWTPWLLAIAAGMFLYIAWVDMMAHMKEMMAQSQDHWLVDFLVQNLGILVGFTIVFLLGWYEDSIRYSLETELHNAIGT